MIGSFLLNQMVSLHNLFKAIFGLKNINTTQEATKRAVEALPRATQKIPIMSANATFLEYVWSIRFLSWKNIVSISINYNFK